MDSAVFVLAGMQAGMAVVCCNFINPTSSFILTALFIKASFVNPEVSTKLAIS